MFEGFNRPLKMGVHFFIGRLNIDMIDWHNLHLIVKLSKYLEMYLAY